ncbi:uncharacterized protein Z520_08469 [Fonsecaea multimorphosa CBS 102226]|uniref:RAD52 homolog n=1 Tax=Fonsecaea multimorphosa CBS 102226 TaxID=1442371 RepID=A0A0D2IF78_9EURO|nr:uncharacterized protein Z520_08469 [Fonsecaea multimorphosa CBS 102226]KIX95761.1 hypothetical protein Z520_08469 [Fonsecaea multimorphosa CBS 102226]OAL21498.1 hypothetical protein AYO22_07894 [Fonsecaea multimorphosa]
MPAVGDQHKPNGSTTANPFEEQTPRITEYTAQEIATLQSRLDKQLGPEYLSSRSGPGGTKLHYLAADKAISLANEVFGFNGWSSSIQNIQIDFVDENPQTGKISLGLSVIVRVTLKDGSHHEDIGYGQIENCKGKAAAFEKAKKEGTTDALKRTLRNFGNVLGNCVYDKNYLSKVTKMKVGSTKWDEGMLHRHADFAPKKAPEEKKPNVSALAQEETPEFEDSFELADFEELDFEGVETGHPDEVALPAEATDSTNKSSYSASERMHAQSRPDQTTTPSKPPANAHPDLRVALLKAPQTLPTTTVIPQPLPGQRQQGAPVPIAKPSIGDSRLPVDNLSRAASPISTHHLPPQQAGQGIGFYSAKAAEALDENNNVISAAAAAAPRFNPHAESPSIRKTSGVNHNRSIPLKRDLTPDTTNLRTNVINPQSDPMRRLGAPGHPSGQISSGTRGPNTSAYRPPTRRGPPESGTTSHTMSSVDVGGGVDRVLQAAKRTPLGDVSNMQQQHHVTSITADGADAKRQRLGDVGQSGTEEAVAGIPRISG